MFFFHRKEEKQKAVKKQRKYMLCYARKSEGRSEHRHEMAEVNGVSI